MEVVGSRGALTIPQPYKPGLDEQILLTTDDGIETITIPGQELYLGEVEDLADAVLLGKPQRIPLSWTRANVATILDLLRSATVHEAVWPRT